MRPAGSLPDSHARGRYYRSGLAGRGFSGRRLRGRKPGDRHPERRARDIVEPDLMAERDRARIATMLAADADLEVAAGRASALDADPDELADAFAVDRHERI